MTVHWSTDSNLRDELLAAKLQRYFGKTCPALAARWAAAVVGMAPLLLGKLADSLRKYEAATDRGQPQLRGAQAAAFENQESAGCHYRVLRRCSHPVFGSC